MPRPRQHSKDTVLSRAMSHFWANGYEGTSMDELVRATGASRHCLYSDFGGKFDLYRESFAAYQDQIVSPALEALESGSADIAEIERYFETQIALAETIGLPGPGCLVANAMTETAPHHEDIAKCVAFHNDRLARAFSNALSGATGKQNDDSIRELASCLVVVAQGLWSISRTVTDAAPLRTHVKTLLSLFEDRLNDLR